MSSQLQTNLLAIEDGLNTAEDYAVGILHHKPIYSTIRELEYIQATGTQYIDTGALANKGLVIEISFKCTATSPNYMRLWGISGASTAEAMMNNVTNTEWAFDGFSTNYTINATSTFRTLKYSRGTMTNVYLDGSSLGVFATKSDTNKNLWLFRGNDRYSNYYLAYCKIWTNYSTLVRDFIPAKRKSDGAIGLYDKVNEIFYANSGTGSFVAGPDVLR